MSLKRAFEENPERRYVMFGGKGGLGKTTFSAATARHFASRGRHTLIISSDLPVLQEVLTPQNAILVPADDLQAWEDAIRRMQADPEERRRLAQQARSDAEHYTWERRASRILENL